MGQSYSFGHHLCVCCSNSHLCLLDAQNALLTLQKLTSNCSRLTKSWSGTIFIQLRNPFCPLKMGIPSSVPNVHYILNPAKSYVLGFIDSSLPGGSGYRWDKTVMGPKPNQKSVQRSHRQLMSFPYPPNVKLLGTVVVVGRKQHNVKVASGSPTRLVLLPNCRVPFFCAGSQCLTSF